MSLKTIHDGQTCEEREASFRLLLKRVATLDVGWEWRGEWDAEKQPPHKPDELHELQLKHLALETRHALLRQEWECALARNSQLAAENASLRLLLKQERCAS